MNNKENSNESILTKYYYELDDSFLGFEECLGTDNKEVRKKMIINSGQSDYLIEFNDPCTGEPKQLGLFDDIVILNSYSNISQNNGGLMVFKIEEGKLKELEREIISIDKEKLSSRLREDSNYEGVYEEFGENTPLTLNLSNKNLELIVNPEFENGGSAPIETYEYKNGMFEVKK